jgi:hypothetical protein
MRYLFLSAGPIILALLSGGCTTTPATAHVECGGTQHVSGDYGYSNGAGFQLGSVRRYVQSKYIRANDHSLTPTSPTSVSLADVTQNVEQSVKIDISANVPATVQVDVKSAISNSMKIEIKGAVSRSEIPGYIDLLNSDAGLKSSILAAIDEPQTKVFLVYAVVLAKEVHFSLENAVNGSASANVLKVGDFEVSVDYKCSDKLDRTKDSPVPMFFKPVWLKKDAAGRIAQDDSIIVDLSNASYVESFE